MRKILDIECYLELFCITFEDYITKERIVFEISQRKNQLRELKEYYRTSIQIGITFNGVDYDDIVLAYVISLPNLMDWKELTSLVKKCSDTVINKDKDYETFRKNYGKFRYNYPYEQLDIYRYWSKLLRIDKKISLKGLGSQLGLDIRETPVPFDTVNLTDEQIDEIISYNGADTDVTGEVVRAKKDDINLRLYAERKYGFKALSWDDVKLGYNTVLYRLSQKSGIPVEELNKWRTKVDQVVLKDIILDKIKFKENDHKRWVEKIDKEYYYCFKTFGALLQHLKQQTVKDANSIKCRVYYRGTVYDIKSGGVHSVHKDDLVVPTTNQIYRDKDVASYYPRLISAYNFGPRHFRHLGFDDLVEVMRLERVAVKFTNPQEAELLKKGLNGGIFGNMNNAFTAMEDLQSFLSVTINGQLMLMMLAEDAEQIDVHVDMANTDGLTFLFDKEKEEEFEAVCTKWEQLSLMDLKSVDYTKVVRKNINNYMAFYTDKDGTRKIKKKGRYFKSKLELTDSFDFLVIPKAVEAYFKSGILPEDFVPKHDNIYDFCASHKIAKTYDVFYLEKKVQQLNRYYVSKQGAYLYKQQKHKKAKAKKASLNPNQLSLYDLPETSKDIKGNLESVLSGVPIKILNYKTDKKAQEFDIDLNYYIVRVRDKIRDFETNQTSIN